MQTVQEIARDIVVREGGFVNDPDDPGGATKHGVTIHTMRRLGLDLDGDGDVDVQDVRQMTAKKAEQIYIRDYFERPRINLLPKPLQGSVMDMYVNSGGNAVKILQKLMAEFGDPIIVDGALGPQTAGAVHRAVDRSSDEVVVNAYGIARRNWYYALADRRTASRKYARSRNGGKGGWIKRAEEFIEPRFHLSDAEHKARVRAWT